MSCLDCHTKHGYWSNIINWLKYSLSTLINLGLSLLMTWEKIEICLPSVLPFIVSYVLPEDSSKGSFDSESRSWSDNVGGECTPGDGCPSVKYPLIAIAASVDCRVLTEVLLANQRRGKLLKTFLAFGLAITCARWNQNRRHCVVGNIY